MTDAPVPDRYGEIEGWRAWTLAGGRLESTGVKGAWEPRRVESALCMKGRSHRAPEESCACGIYALKSLDLARRRFGHRIFPHVFGKVRLWGKVIEADEGYRAEFAKMERLYVPAELVRCAAYLEEEYGVSVHVLEEDDWTFAERARWLAVKFLAYGGFAMAGVGFVGAALWAGPFSVPFFPVLGVPGGLAMLFLGFLLDQVRFDR